MEGDIAEQTEWESGEGRIQASSWALEEAKDRLWAVEGREPPRRAVRRADRVIVIAIAVAELVSISHYP